MPRSARKEGYSRRHRFAERGSFGPVLRSPRKARGPLVTVHAAPGSAPVSRLGIALTRRLVRSAVHRNQVKRLVREVYRHHDIKASGLDCVVSLRERFQPGTAASLAREVARLFDELAKGAR